MLLIAWVILQDSAGRVLLGRRSETRYAGGLWNLPGGGVERGEALAAAAAREVWEEVGVRVDPADLRPLGVSRYDLPDAAGCDFFFLAREWRGTPQPLENTSEVGWFAPDSLPADALPWLPRVLAAYLLRGEWLSEEVGVAG